jgi:cysteinyl-tRNA synthetase
MCPAKIEDSLFLTNTLSRRKDRFKSREPGKVKLVTCGPSVYREPHVGNYRTFLFEDVLHRYLEYLGHSVQRLINFTDVEDKALEEMRKTGQSRKAVTGPIEEKFMREADLLHLKMPEIIAKSSTSVEQAVELIQILLRKGCAYWHGKDVFFDPLTFNGFGKLFGLDMSRWPKKKKRFYKDTYPGQRWNLGDFILWHGCGHADDEETCWETEIGRGRPSWNIQDPAMAVKHIGYEADISCGGVDNLYRHHDYNIAVLEAASGRTFAPYWLHGEHVLIDGKKMSKSKGNTVYLDDLLKKGFSAEHIRFFLIYKHYRQKLDLTEKGLLVARDRLDAFNRKVKELIFSTGPVDRPKDRNVQADAADLASAFEKGLNDDLNVAGAFDALESRVAKLLVLNNSGGLTRQALRETAQCLKRINHVLKIIHFQ